MDNVYYLPGDLVTLNKDIPNKPIMLVIRKSNKFAMSKSNAITFQGIECRWFTKDGLLQEATWNTKDLQKL